MLKLPLLILLTLTGCTTSTMNTQPRPDNAPAPRTPPAAFFLSFPSDAQGNRFRVNSPDTATGRFADRKEAQHTGQMTIALDDDLAHIASAELYLELWGGHPGVANKRFNLNGHGPYPLPEVGAADKNCTYSYPVIPLDLAHLRPGQNDLAFTCDKGTTFWGHYIIRAAAIRLRLKPTHPRLADPRLAGFTAAVSAAPAPGESLRLALDCPPQYLDRIASVEYHARYDGYDDNGDGQSLDWHGFTKDHAPLAIAAAADAAPFAATWDLAMVPDQKDIHLRALIRFKDQPNLACLTAPLPGLATPARPDGQRVSLHPVQDLPKPFWSRAGRKPACTIPLDIDPARIRRAQLHIVVWDGGRGTIPAPLTLNGQDLPTPDWRGRHDPIYSILDIDPALLRPGQNHIQLHSDTTHHGIEVCLPGPALLLRWAP